MLLFSSCAFAEEYPSREITGIVKIDDNGTDDPIARKLANNAGKYLGQPVSLWTFTENSGTAALKYLQSAQPDGYTFYIGKERADLTENSAASVNHPNYDNFTCVYLIGESTAGITVMPIQGKMSMQTLRHAPKSFKYVPYGFIYGVYVKRGTPENVILKLADSFKKAGEDPEIKNMLDANDIRFSGLTDSAAQNYLNDWRGGTFDKLVASVPRKKAVKKSEPEKKSEPVKESEPAQKSQPAKKLTTSSGFPAHDIDAVVQWGTGGATDVLTRAATEIAQNNLPVKINVRNVMGNNGSVGLEEVYSKNADGYTLLMGTENPALYDVLGMSQHTYEDFECVYLIGDIRSLVAVSPSSKYHTFSDLINEAKAHPGSITCGTTGRGSLGWMMNALIKGTTGADFATAEYSNNAEIREAVKNGECDISITLEQEGVKDFHDGSLRFLTIMAIEESEEYPGVEPVVNQYPDFFACLPWGSFFGIYAKGDTDPEVLDILSEAYKKAGDDQNFRKLLKHYGLNYLGYTGDEANNYVSSWRNRTIDALISSGAEDITMPEEKVRVRKKRPASAKKSTPAQDSTTAQSPTPAQSSTPAQALKTSSGFPDHAINGIIQWGQGGVTDVLSRALTISASKYLNMDIKMQNITGNAGVTGLEYVYKQKADGYTLLMGAENPALYDKIGLSDLTYDDFECVYLIGDVTAGIIVNPNSKYQTFTDLIHDALEHPEQIKCATTGQGSVGWVVDSFIRGVTDARFNLIEYDSTVTTKEAVMKGECDFAALLLQQGIDEFNDGSLRFLTVLAIDEHPKLPGVSPIVSEYPGFFVYMPWGPFYGVFAKKGTDPEILKVLGQAYKQAGDEKECRDLLEKYNVNYLGYAGDEAKKYISNWRANTVDALITSGALD